MMPLKTVATLCLASSLVLLTACSQDTNDHVVVVDAPVQQSPEPETDRPQRSPEQRAAAQQAQAEKSASTQFTTAPLINPNTATQQQLSSIPGLSPAAVQAIFDNRPFSTPSELHAAIGNDINEEDLFSVYSAVFVKVKLNSSPNEDFLLVPTTMPARRLAHEFEEYRPYKSIDDFSREMSKYVSDKEVSFLERFVSID